ncbi:hypothetical protein L6307_01870 [Candidatus Parcubacteria bacterium]|nr:hypothetical protein [Patescibacteria group bacterium]MCG2697826.1 hypothetical protein [Candidatus Parcubacteria bacterium]
MAKNNYKKQEKIIKEVEKINHDFLKKLDDLRLEHDKKIQEILDKSKMRKIRKSL